MLRSCLVKDKSRLIENLPDAIFEILFMLRLYLL